MVNRRAAARAFHRADDAARSPEWPRRTLRIVLAMVVTAGAGLSPPTPAAAEAPAPVRLPGQEALSIALPAPIPAEELATRRARLMDALGDGLYYFAGAAAPARDYETWAQEADFHYLTGFEEPDARLLMVRSGDDSRAVLFVRDRNPGREIWEGHRAGPEGATELTGIESRSLDEFDAVVGELVRRGPPALVSARRPTEDEVTGRIFELLGAEAGAEGVEWRDPRRTLRRLRSVKSAAEIELLQVASTITRRAHVEAMRAVEEGMNEFEVEALIEYTFRRYGAARPGFASIVGSGPNSTTLHYNANDRFMEAGDTLVMDIGAEYGRYTTDITRTVPVSGTFSRQQREIYEIVLAAQLAAEELAREIGVSWRDLNGAARDVLAEGLARLGLIEAADARLPNGRPQLSLFYMHGLGHGIGLDVHDPNLSTVEPGTAFTLEPGLYVREDALDRIGTGEEADALRARLRPAIERYRGIGVRIEDAYAFTEGGLVRLSAGIPRTIDEIEATMAEESPVVRGRDGELVELYRRLRPPDRRR